MALTWPGAVYSLGFVLCVVHALNAWQQRQIRGGVALPPGPTGLPFIGNFFDLNFVHPWLSYEQWAKQYGALVYANILGKDFIIINTPKVAHDLLERRSGIYSGRPHIPANKTFGMDFNSGLLPYGDKWRLHRKLFNIAFNKRAALQYRPMAICKARQFAKNLVNAPEDYIDHCKTFAAATIMAATYAYEVAPKNDPIVTKIEHFVGLFMTVLTPEWTALITALPFLAYIPSWLPCGEYMRRAESCRVLANEILEVPVEYVVQNMAAETAGESLVRQLFERQDSEKNVEAIKAVAASAFLGGAETSDSTLRMFILAMALYPEVQTQAREEIDRVVGTDRLPGFEDRLYLPYVEAVYLETLRWRPVVPSALPHVTESSDVYEGMYIPKGAIVLTNIWGMGHDELRFRNAMTFDPGRHMTCVGTLAEDTANHSFGFGRRICPGRHIADQNIWAAIVTMLATVHIAKARDEFGYEINVEAEFTSGIATAPKPFACSIRPRSASAENLLRVEASLV